MPVSAAAKVVDIADLIQKGKEPKAAHREVVGDLSGVDVLSDLVLVVTYIPPPNMFRGRETKLIMPGTVTQESEYQGKVGLVLKLGPLAYADWESEEDRGQNAKLHTWVVYAIKDGWPITLNGTPCRVVPYEKIRMRVTDPNIVY